MNGGELTARVGELRRLTVMFCDVVDSTELAYRQEPETYRELLRGYRIACRDVIESRFEGHIVQLKGDGLLSTFGFPVAHENDAERAVLAGLALVRAVRDVSSVATSTTGESLEVRVAVHHGPVYLDIGEGDIYGLTANVAARLQALADPGTVVVSSEVRALVEDRFVIEPVDPQRVKGLDEPLQPFRVIGDRRVPVRRSWPTPLLERETELGRLRDAWARAGAGTAARARGVLIRADAGVGKSRLVAALVDEVSAASVIQLHGSPLHRDVGFHPVRTLIETRCGVSDDTGSGERLDRLAREVTDLGLDRSEAVPLLAAVLGIHPGVGYDPASTEGRKLEEQVAQCVLGYMLACTQGQPGLVVAENLHWFDDATRELLADLLRVGPGSMLVVATSREPERGAWDDTIELQPLTPAGCHALIQALDDRLTDHDRTAFTARSGGIPLYLEELVRAGAVDQSGRAGEAVPVPGSVPKVLYEPLVARLYATPAALPVAATAAAAGQEVHRALLAATMSIEEEELDAPLRELVEAAVLEPIEGRSVRYRFRHELLREVAYELQPPSWRRRVHDRLCDVLTREEPSDWHVLASHFERAERHSEASAAYQQTAESARRRGALGEARAHLTRAIDLVMSLPREAARDHREVELRLRRGFLAMSTEGAGSPEASADFDRCLELAAADPEGDDMFSTLISVWAYDLARGELDRARQVSETLRGAIGERHYFRPPNLAGFGMLDWFGGNFPAALDTLTAAAEELPEVGREDALAAVWFVPNDPIVATHVHLALARFTAGDLAGGEVSIARARAVAASLDFPQGPWSTGYANWLGSWMWIEAGRLDLAGTAIAELQASSDRHGFDTWALMAATQSAVLDGITSLRSGDAGAAELSEHAEAISAYIELWEALELRVFLPFYFTSTGALLAAAGDADGAQKRYEESLELAARTGMHFYDAETMRLLAQLETDRDGVLTALRKALDLARSQAAPPFELRIALDLHALVGEPARRDLEEARARMLTRT
jgi:class 3 adenylate cyclase/tetratricopeptide (TPR) repeat protein